MADSDYLDFDLKIERTTAGYRAQVMSSPGGEAVNDFTLPFSDLELENFLLRIGRPRRGLRRLESPEMALAKEFGGKLFHAALGGDVQGCFRSSLDEANRRGGRLRIRLRLKNAPDLADLPWEFLYNPEINRFYGLSVETPIVRYLDLPMQITPLAIRPPLRLLVVIASPQDYEPLDVEGEWSKLQEALRDQIASGAVALDRLTPPTLPALRDRLRRADYHVFHFIGHGAFDESVQDGVLLLEDAGGRGRPTTGESLGTVLRDQRTLRLAVVNACEGGRTSRTDPFAGVAQSLLQQGIPAVIAMQFPISDLAAATFSHEFYAAVAASYPLDAALSEARKAIRTDVNDVEWVTPVLYMRSADTRIFDVAAMLQPSPPVVVPPTPVRADRRQEQERGQRLAELETSALEAFYAEEWDAAIERYEAILALQPNLPAAATKLAEATRQRALLKDYVEALRLLDAGRLTEACARFEAVQAQATDYRDVEALLARTRVKLAELAELKIAQELATRPAPPAARPPKPSTLPEEIKARPRPRDLPH